MTMIEAGGVATESDAELLARARAGDERACGALLARHYGVAVRVAHRLLGHEHDAQDAVHDGMVKALAHLKDFDGRSGFRTWWLKIVTNAAHDLGRRRRRRPWVSLEDATTSNAGSNGFSHEGDDPSAGLRRDDLRKVINAALERLSAATRTTFVLFAEAELSYKEIAEVQRVPIGTVMSRIHYARQKLQVYLDETGADLT